MSGGPPRDGFDDPSFGGRTYDEIMAAGRSPRRPRGGGTPVSTVLVVVGIVVGLALLSRMVMAGREEVVTGTVTPGPAFTLGPVQDGTVPFGPLAPGETAPQAFRVAGNGTRTVEVVRPDSGATLLHLNVDAPRGTVVREVDANGVARAVHATAFGRYSGLRVVALRDERTRLRVETTGTWTVELRSARSAAARQSPFTGSGDDVFWYLGPPGFAEVSTTAPLPTAGTVHVDVVRENGSHTKVAVLTGEGTQRVQWPYGGPVLVQVAAPSGWLLEVFER